MIALSLQQPWLYAITDLDKRIENRTWKLSHLVIGQRIALHASLKDDQLGYSEILRIAGVQVPADLPRGCIVATAIVGGNVIASDDKWFFGPYGWLLTDIRKLSEPVYCKGDLGLWTVPAGVLA